MDPKYHYPNPSIRVLSSREAEEVRECERSNKLMASQWTCTHCSEHLDSLKTGEAVMQHLSDLCVVHTIWPFADFGLIFSNNLGMQLRRLLIPPTLYSLNASETILWTHQNSQFIVVKLRNLHFGASSVRTRKTPLPSYISFRISRTISKKCRFLVSLAHVVVINGFPLLLDIRSKTQRSDCNMRLPTEWSKFKP